MHKLLPLSPTECQGQGWLSGQQARQLAACATLPVQAFEAGSLAAAMPLALLRDAGQESGWSLVAVCGKRDGVNLYFDASGRWQAHVQPASNAHYPFVLMPLGKDKVLPCFDTQSGLLSRAPEAEAFFDEQGQLAGRAREQVQALIAQHSRVQQTQTALSALSRAGLLVPWSTALLERRGIALAGLHGVDEKALHALSDEAFLALRSSGALTLAYAISFSLNQLHLLERLERLRGNAPAVAAMPSDVLDLEFLNRSGTISFG